MNKGNLKVILALVLFVSLVLITAAGSYAFFTYMKSGSAENTIRTGTLTFIYDEKEAQGNGINMTNVFPMSDSIGKTLIGTNNVFDFQVLSTAKGADINYEIIIEKQEGFSLRDESVKIYLTTLSGEVETEVSSTIINNDVTSYKELVDTTIDNQTGKTLHQGVIPNGEVNYNEQFRLRMWLSDSANDQTEGEWDYSNKSFAVKVNVVANGAKSIMPSFPTYTDTSGANVPELVEGMIPVVYDDVSSSWKKADVVNGWYDYDSQIWANVVTVTETNRAKLMSSPSGTKIPMKDINTMWVWIPRYEYKYDNMNSSYAGGTKTQPGELKINFLSKDVTTPSESSTYKVHPAFTFGDKELSGLWFGKFETSTKEVCTVTNGSVNANCDLSTLTPQIKPGVVSWRGARVSTFFTTSRNIQTINYATYGFSNSTNYDTHMSKNIEWGVVAYLSQSKYGKYGNSTYTGVNKEVAINNCSTYITGIGGDTVNAGSSTLTCTTNTYETIKGQGASTTGNITGVYDMAGGVNEYNMSVLADLTGKARSGNSKSYNSGFNGILNDGTTYTEGIDFPDSKYYDLYVTSNMSTACSGGICFGQSLSETASWYSDNSRFVFTSYPWSIRGGNYNNTSSAGVFFMSDDNGSAGSSFGSRLTLIP